MPSSVITSYAYLSIDQQNHIQETNTSLAPKMWFFKNPSKCQKESIVTVSKEEIDFFRTSRNAFIEERTHAVQNEQKLEPDGHGYYDFIDKIILRRKEVESEKVCINCGAANNVQYNKCKNIRCTGQLVKRKADVQDIINGQYNIENARPYVHFSDLTEAKENSIAVKAGEPDFLNPNSYDNIPQILHEILDLELAL